VGFVVDKVALGQIFSEYFGSLPNLHSTNFSAITITYHLELVQKASSGRSNKSPIPLIKKSYGLRALKVGVQFPAGAKFFFFSTASRLALEPTQPLIHWVSRAIPGMKAAEARM
jgi:hypothetical protein